MKFPEMLTGVQHIGVPTNDLEKTVAFYETIGFQPVLETVNEAANERVTFLQLKNLVIETYENHAAVGEPGAIDHIALDTTDVEAAFAAAKEAGLTMLDDEIHELLVVAYFDCARVLHRQASAEKERKGACVPCGKQAKALTAPKNAQSERRFAVCKHHEHHAHGGLADYKGAGGHGKCGR